MHRAQLTNFQKILWVAYLALALVFVQGVRLHVHTYYSHDPLTSDHTHQQQAHADYIDYHYDSENGHPDEVGQIDLTQQGFLKKLILGVLFIALFVAVFVLLPRRLCSRVSRNIYRRIRLAYSPVSLRPPLRAPPF